MRSAFPRPTPIVVGPAAASATLPHSHSHSHPHPHAASLAHHTPRPAAAHRLDVLAAVAGSVHAGAVVAIGLFLLLSLTSPWHQRHTAGVASSVAIAAVSGVSVLQTEPNDATIGPSVLQELTSSGGAHTLSGNHSEGAHPHSSSTTSSLTSTDGWWLVSPTTTGQCLLFLFSTLFFTADLIALHFRGRLHRSAGRRKVIHHLLSIASLCGCIWSRADGPIVLVAMVLCEFANTPHYAQLLCKYAYAARRRERRGGLGEFLWISSSVRRLMRRMLRPLLYVCLSMDLTLAHGILFLFSRLICVEFTAHGVMPFAQLATTRICSVCLLLLSSAMFLDLLPMYSGKAGKDKSRNLIVEMRELRDECCGEDDDSDYEDQQPATRRRSKSSGSGSGWESRTPRSEARTPKSAHTPRTHALQTGIPLIKRRLMFWS